MSKELKYYHIDTCDLKNGTGIRVVLWVAGCSHHCKNCQNRFTWNHEQGLHFDTQIEEQLMDALRPSYIEGITLSGGDPLYLENRDGVGKLVMRISKEMPKKSIWLYTGYDFICMDGKFVFRDGTDVFELPWLSCVDVIADGKYDDEVRKDDLKKGRTVHWVGSSNQHVIDVKKSLNAGGIVLFDDVAFRDDMERMPEMDILRQLYKS